MKIKYLFFYFLFFSTIFGDVGLIVDIGLGLAFPEGRTLDIIEKESLSNFIEPIGGRFHFGSSLVLWDRIRLGGGLDSVRRGTKIYSNRNFTNDMLAEQLVQYDLNILNVIREIKEFNYFVDIEYYLKKNNNNMKRGTLNVGLPFKVGFTKVVFEDTIVRTNVSAGFEFINVINKAYNRTTVSPGLSFYYRASKHSQIYVKYIHTFLFGGGAHQYSSIMTGINIAFKIDIKKKRDSIKKNDTVQGNNEELKMSGSVEK